MNLKPRAIILLAIDAFGGQVGGKTLLQKRLYFTEILLGENLGLDFDAHFYGPYSALINSELTTLKLQNQVRENTDNYGVLDKAGFEMRRFSYALTDDGKAGVGWIRQNYAGEARRVTEAAKRVVDAGNLDYMDLSFAAKSHWILRQAQKPLSDTDIANEANRFGWEVKPAQVHSGVEFLKKVGLAESKAPVPNP